MLHIKKDLSRSVSYESNGEPAAMIKICLWNLQVLFVYQIYLLISYPETPSVIARLKIG